MWRSPVPKAEEEGPLPQSFTALALGNGPGFFHGRIPLDDFGAQDGDLREIGIMVLSGMVQDPAGGDGPHLTGWMGDRGEGRLHDRGYGIVVETDHSQLLGHIYPHFFGTHDGTDRCGIIG